MAKKSTGPQGTLAQDVGKEERGSTLHREFVGMVFALAIAEVAIQGAPIANSTIPWRVALPAFTHLGLATLVIAVSWVGWGRSKDSESNIKNVFSGDFLELLVDLWLVAVYFFIAKGVDAVTNDNVITINPSLDNEVFWIAIALGTYVVWDGLTKWKRPKDLIQRGWASATCAFLGYLAYKYFPKGDIGATRVVLGDLSLAFLVLLFRAMKVNNLPKLTGWEWGRIVALIALFSIAGFASADFNPVVDWWNPGAQVDVPQVPAQ